VGRSNCACLYLAQLADRGQIQSVARIRVGELPRAHFSVMLAEAAPQPTVFPSRPRRGTRIVSVDHLHDLLLLWIDQHHLIADREITIGAQFGMGAREFFRHRLE
jgi:hypothetical protein